VTTAQFALELEQNFINHLKKTMGDELIDPDPRQVEYIKSVKWD
jgi:hypothetical protein